LYLFNPQFVLEQVAEQTVGYSGADIELVCRESAMMPVRRLMQRIDELDNNNNPFFPAAECTASSTSTRNMTSAIQQQNQQSKGSIPPKTIGPPPRSADIESLLRADPVTHNDILAALRTTKPSSDGNIVR
jgi:SpoVK/Ycf46/Vps4 family AAA+-type ATPase